jgi:hypothetical protein
LARAIFSGIGIAAICAGALFAYAKDSEAKPALSGTHIGGGSHNVSTQAGACSVNQECSVKIRLEANAEFHINDNFPYKFKANQVSGVTFLGKKEATVFSKSDNDFEKKGAKMAELTVRFKPSAKGKVTISGEFKMSVCSDGNCVVDHPNVSADVTVN